MRRENKGRTELREKKENEKQTVQDREISETQWCIAGTKAEMEVKEGCSKGTVNTSPSGAVSAFLSHKALRPSTIPWPKPGAKVSLMTAAKDTAVPAATETVQL